MTKPKLPLRRVVWLPAFICLVGLLGLFFFGILLPGAVWRSLNFSTLLRDVSLTLVIIGALGLLLELSEFAGYFEERLLGIVIHEEFLSKLDADRLRELSMSAIHACVAKALRNPEYRAEEVFQQVLTDIVPLIGKVYREGYRETVEVVPLEPAEVERRLGLPPNTISSDRQITFSKTTTEFTFVAPTHDKETEEPYRWSSKIRKIPGIDSTQSDKYVKIRMRLGNGPWEDLLVTAANETDDEVEFVVDRGILFKGKIRISMTDEEYAYGGLEYLVKKMTHLTRGMYLNVASEVPVNFDSEIFGLLTEETEEPHKTGNSISLRYDGWLLPNDGYVFYGEAREVTGECYSKTCLPGESAGGEREKGQTASA